MWKTEWNDVFETTRMYVKWILNRFFCFVAKKIIISSAMDVLQVPTKTLLKLFEIRNNNLSKLPSSFKFSYMYIWALFP